MNENKVKINYKNFYMGVIALVIPMALQNLIDVGVMASDVFMLGRVGEASLSGASLGGQIYYVMNLFLFGLTSGATVLTSQYWGKKDKVTIEKILALGMKSALIVTSLFMIVSLIIPHKLIGIFTTDPLVISEGVIYLRIISFSFIITGIIQTYLLVMRSVERVIAPTVIYFISFLLNVVLNAIFIFGLAGLPAMGVKGAALGTLVTRIIELFIVFGYAKVFNKEIKFRFKYFFKSDKWLVKDFFIYATPVILNEVLWGLGGSANTAILGHLGSAAVAANSVAQVARQLATVVSFGVSTATAIYLGKTIGENKIEEAKIYAKHFIVISVILGVGGGVLILGSIKVVLKAMVLTATAKEYLRFMFFVMSYFVIAQSYNSTMVVGIFRAGGDTKYGLIMDVISMWGFAIPLGFIAAFILKLSVPVVYVLLMSDEFVKIALDTVRYRKYIWLKDITKEKENQK